MRKELSLENPDNEEQRFELFFPFPSQHIFFHWSFSDFSFILNESLHSITKYAFVSRVHHKRVFETVKNINQSVRQQSSANSATNIPGSNQTLSSLSSALSDSNSNNAAPDNRTQSMLQETGSSDAA